MPISDEEWNSAPVPAAGQPISDAEWDAAPSAEDVAGEENARLGRAFASLKDKPERRAGVLRFAIESGIPADVVDKRFDDFQRTWEASNFDTAAWRKANPELAQLALERPDIAPVVVREKALNPLMKVLRLMEAGENVQRREAAEAIGEEPLTIPFGMEGTGEAAAASFGAVFRKPGDALPGESTTELAKPGALFPMKQVPMETDASASGGTLDRVQAAFRAGQRQKEYSALGTQMLFRMARGQDTFDLEKHAVDMKRELTARYYGETGALEQTLLDAAEMLPSMLETYKGSGLGGAAGVAIGAGVGALTRQPGAVKTGAGIGLKLGSRAGAALASFNQESGGAFLDLLEEKTDDGKPLDRKVAAGAAVAYGLAAAAIENATFGVELSAWGPLGDAIRKGSGKVFLKEALKDAGFRKIAADVGKRWLKGALGEGIEEFSQQAAQELSTYAARSIQAGSLQNADIRGGLERSTDALVKAVSGSIALGPAQGVTSGVSTVVGAKIAQAQAERAAAKVPVIAAVAESATAKADPAAAARLVEEATAKSGEPVTAMHVDAQAFVRLFQGENSDPAEAATRLLGPEGPRMLQEAIATGTKLEVPVATYLERWNEGDVAKRLAEDTTTAPGHLTPRQLAAQSEEIEKRAKELAAEFSKEEAAAPPAGEAAWADALEKQLVATKRMTAKEARTQVNLHRAFIRSQAERFGVPAEQLFANFEVTAQRGDEAPSTAGKLEQGATEPAVAEASALLSERLDGEEPLTPEQRANELYRDPVSGLMNRRGWDASPRSKGKMVAVITSPDIKALNDDPTGGHDVANALLRTIGATVAQVDPGAARSGTNFLLEVGSDQELASALERVRQALPDPSLAVEGALGFNVDKAFNKLDRAVAEKRASGALAARGKTKFDLTKLPGLQFAAQPASVALPSELVTAAAGLAPADFFREAYQDREVPGVLSATGWNAIPRKAAVASLDLKGLKAVNERLGKEMGDRVLQLFGQVAQEIGGSEFDFAHLSGDEYAAQHNDSKALSAFLADLRAALQDVGIPVTLNGREEIIRADFRHGIGEGTYGSADRDLNTRKRAEGNDAGRALGRDGQGREGGAQGSDVAGPVRVEGGRATSQRRGAPAQAFRDRRGAGRQEGRLGQSATYYAGDPDRPRGYMESAQSGLKRMLRIALNESADLSTFLHESGHVFLEVFGDLAERPDAPERVHEDFAAALKWMGVDKRSDIQTEHHEKWARAFEAYLFEGKAPSSRLAAAFERFKLWMRQVYASFASLKVDLNGDIRGVFDRLLATDAEIQGTQKAMGLTPMFRSPEEAGMTPDQWQAYLKDAEEATSHATRALERRVLKDRLRETESWWNDQTAKELAAAGEEYSQLATTRAMHFLRTGDFVLEGPEGEETDKGPAPKLDPERVRYYLGREPASRLRPLMKRGGLDPDEMVDLFGFGTSHAFLEALERHPERDTWVKQRAQERMAEKYPEVLADKERMRELASNGLHSEQTARWLLKEWDALRKKAGGAAAPVEAIKKAAKLIAERRTVRKLDVGGALRAERSAAEAAARAAANGDYAQAAVLKQQQLLNMYLNRELSEARELRDSFVELAGDLSDEKTRARLGKAATIYRDGVDLILETLGLKPQEEQREKALPGLGEVAQRMSADGATIMFDEEVVFRVLAKPQDWKDLSAGELREVDAALKNIRAAARSVSTALVDGKRFEKDMVITQLLQEAAANLKDLGPLVNDAVQTVGEKIGGLWSVFDGSLLKPETVIRGMLGGGALDSMWFRAVMKPLQDSKAKEVDLLNSSIKPILEAFETVPQEVRDRFMEKVDGRKLFPSHIEDLLPRTRLELLMIALNAGNQSNLDRLTGGRLITEQQVMDAINLLTKEELDWVQSVWDAAESLWPESRVLEERDSGLAPPKIERRALVTRNGTYAGGYFPAVYDRLVEAAGEKRVLSDLASLLDPSYTRPGTARSHLKNRVEGFTGAISLNPQNISTHLAQVAHDIAFREALKSVGGLILNPEIQAALKHRLGDGRAKQFLQWLKDVGSMRGAEGYMHAGIFLRATRALRGNAVIAALGFSAKNAIEDLSNLVAAIPRTELKARHLASALGDFARAPVASVEEAMAKSGELRTRHSEMQRELRKQIRDLTSKGGLARRSYRWIQDHAFVFMEFSDKATSTPIWMGAYRQALAEGKSDADAVTFADVVVRQVFPSHSPVDQAPILRDKGVIGNMLMFYGFLSTYYNGIREILHPLHTADDLKEGAKRAPVVGGRLLAYMLAVGVLSEFLRGRGPEKDDGEELPEQLANWTLRKLLVSGLASVPFGGDAGNTIEGALMGRRTNPRNQSLVSVGTSLGKAIFDLANEDKDIEKRVSSLVQSAGPVFGFPAAQTATTGKYLYEVGAGEREVEGPFDFAGGVIYGKRDAK